MPTKEGLALLFSNRSASHLAGGNAEMAWRDGEVAASQWPDWPRGHYRTAAALHALGRWEEAECAYDRCLQLQPEGDQIFFFFLAHRGNPGHS